MSHLGHVAGATVRAAHAKGKVETMKRIVALSLLALLPARMSGAETPSVAASTAPPSSAGVTPAPTSAAALSLPSLPTGGVLLLEQAARLEAQRNYVEAHTAYSELSREYSAALQADDQAALSRRLSELDAKMGEISFEGFAPGTTIRLGTTDLGTLPLAGRLRVNPGQAALTLTLAGYQTSNRTEEVGVGAHVVVRGPLQVQAPESSVTFGVGLPPGYALGPGEILTLTIDGKPAGNVPWQGQLSVGRHSVSLQGQRFFAPEREIVVPEGAPLSTDIPVHLAPAHLDIKTAAGDAIILDGARVAQGTYTGQLSSGQHLLRVEHAGVETHSQQLSLEPGQQLTLEVPPAAAGTSNGATAGQAASSTFPPPEPGALDSGSGEENAGKGLDWSPGLYGDFIFLGLIGTRSNHQWNDACPDLSGLGVSSSCSTRAPLGLGIGGRVGYSFGVVGLEGFALGAGDYSAGRLDANLGLNLPGFLTDMQVGRVGGGFGAGARVTTPPWPLRARLGVSGGVMFRRVFSNVSSLNGSSNGYAAPLLLADLTITLFNSFSLGAVFMVEFVDSVVLRPDLGPLEDNAPGFSSALGDVEVFHGTEYFFGPVLSFHFGH